MSSQNKMSPSKSKTIHNLKELKSLCAKWAKALTAPQAILLEGPLAVGKTQAVRYMATALNFPSKEIMSPAYSLIQIYKKQPKNFIYHADLYRLKTQKEIESAGFWDIFHEPSLVFIEWPLLIQNKLPPSWNKLFIQMDFAGKPSGRMIKWEWEKAP